MTRLEPDNVADHSLPHPSSLIPHPCPRCQGLQLEIDYLELRVRRLEAELAEALRQEAISDQYRSAH